MLPRQWLWLCLLACVGVMTSTTVTAQDVSAFPQRIIFTPQERFASITLFNRGNEPARYRISFVNYRQMSDGQMRKINQPLAEEGFADEMIRYSPRQIILPPDEPQTVRLMSRIPADLQEGEYRSHLLIQSVPDAAPAQEQTEQDQLSVKLDVVYGFSIPVFIQKGELDHAGHLEFAGFNDDRQPILRIYNDGTRHLRADIVAIRGGEEIGRVKGAAVYLSTGHLDLAMPMDTTDFRGVVFELRAHETDTVLAELAFPGDMASTLDIVPE